jgi:hypothetical protein
MTCTHSQAAVAELVGGQFELAGPCRLVEGGEVVGALPMPGLTAADQAAHGITPRPGGIGFSHHAHTLVMPGHPLGTPVPVGAENARKLRSLPDSLIYRPTCGRAGHHRPADDLLSSIWSCCQGRLQELLAGVRHGARPPLSSDLPRQISAPIWDGKDGGRAAPDLIDTSASRSRHGGPCAAQ